MESIGLRTLLAYPSLPGILNQRASSVGSPYWVTDQGLSNRTGEGVPQATEDLWRRLDT